MANVCDLGWCWEQSDESIEIWNQETQEGCCIVIMMFIKTGLG